MIPFPDKKYQIIYADPPWNSNTQFGREKRKGNAPHYPLMTTQDIADLPVNSIAADNCVLFLWVVDTQLQDGLNIMRSWGFTYKTVGFTWVKKTVTGKDHFGVGAWTRKNPEMCLFGTKGTPKKASSSVRQLHYGTIREHSRKPDAIRHEIVQLCGDVPRIELFARTRSDGWDCWGNEV